MEEKAKKKSTEAAPSTKELLATIAALKEQVAALASKVANCESEKAPAAVLGEMVRDSGVYEATCNTSPARVLRIGSDMWIAMPSNSVKDKHPKLTWVPFDMDNGGVEMDPALQCRCQEYLDSCNLTATNAGYVTDFLGSDSLEDYDCDCCGCSREEPDYVAGRRPEIRIRRSGDAPPRDVAKLVKMLNEVFC